MLDIEAGESDTSQSDLEPLNTPVVDTLPVVDSSSISNPPTHPLRSGTSDLFVSPNPHSTDSATQSQSADRSRFDWPTAAPWLASLWSPGVRPASDAKIKYSPVDAPVKVGVAGRVSQTAVSSPPNIKPVASSSQFGPVSFPDLSGIEVTSHRFCPIPTRSSVPSVSSSVATVTESNTHLQSDSDSDDAMSNSTVVTPFAGAKGPVYKLFKKNMRLVLVEKQLKKTLGVDKVFQLINGYMVPDSPAEAHFNEIYMALAQNHIGAVMAGLAPSHLIPVLPSDPDPDRVAVTMSFEHFLSFTNVTTNVTVMIDPITKCPVTHTDVVLHIFWALMDRQYEAADSLDISSFWVMKQADTVPNETASAFAARLNAKLHGMGGRVSMKEALHVWFRSQKDAELSAAVNRQMESLPDAKYNLLTAQRYAETIEQRRDDQRIMDQRISACQIAIEEPVSKSQGGGARKVKFSNPVANLPDAVPETVAGDKHPNAPCYMRGHRGHKNKDCRVQHPELRVPAAAPSNINEASVQTLAKAFMLALSKGTSSTTPSVNAVTNPPPPPTSTAKPPTPTTKAAVSDAPQTAGYLAKRDAKQKPSSPQPPKSAAPLSKSGLRLCSICALHLEQQPCFIMDPSKNLKWAPFTDTPTSIVEMWRAARKKLGIMSAEPPLRDPPRRFNKQPVVHNVTAVPLELEETDEDGTLMSGVCHASATAGIHALPFSFVPKPICDPPGVASPPTHSTNSDQVDGGGNRRCNKSSRCCSSSCNGWQRWRRAQLA